MSRLFPSGTKFLEDVYSSNSIDSLSDTFGEFISQVGLNTFRMSQRPKVGTATFPGMVLDRVPDGWLEHYRRESYRYHDPVLLWTARGSGPINWQNARALAPSSAKSRQLEADARAAGLVDGLAFSAAGRNGLRGNVWLGSPKPLQLQKGELQVLHLCSVAAYETAGKLLGINAQVARPLTPRQREALSWVARGKTEAEAALVMGVSRRTVDAFLQEARARLGAASTAQAVALAIEAGELV